MIRTDRIVHIMVTSLLLITLVTPLSLEITITTGQISQDGSPVIGF